MAALVVLRARLGGSRPPATVGARRRWRWRPRSSPRASCPGHGKIVGLAVMALVGIAYVAVLVVTREFGPEDRAKFAKVFKR